MRVCTRCGIEYPADADHFYRHRRRSGGYRLVAECKRCMNARTSAWARSHPESRNATQQRWAAKNRDKTRSYGRAWSKKVGEERLSAMRAWREAHREHVKAYDRRYKAENQERLRERARQRNQAHAELKRARARAYYEREGAARRAYSRAWQKRNPIRHRLQSRLRKLRLRGATEAGIDQGWAALLALCGGRCLACGSTEDITMDHVIPLVRAGRHGIDNPQPLCRSCNSRKGTKITDYRPWSAAPSLPDSR